MLAIICLFLGFKFNQLSSLTVLTEIELLLTRILRIPCKILVYPQGYAYLRLRIYMYVVSKPKTKKKLSDNALYISQTFILIVLLILSKWIATCNAPGLRYWLLTKSLLFSLSGALFNTLEASHLCYVSSGKTLSFNCNYLSTACFQNLLSKWFSSYFCPYYF